MNSRVVKHFIKHLMDEEDDDRVVVKTIPVKPEWKKLWVELEEAKKVRDAAEAKRDILKKAFWSKVSMDTGMYEEEMQMDTENNEIKVFASNNEE